MADQDDHTEFSEVIDILAQGPSDVGDETPPPSVWEAIDAELQAEEAKRPHERLDHRPFEQGREASIGEGEDYSRPATNEPESPAVSLSDRRTGRSRRGEYTAMIVGVAAALLLVGVPLVLALRSSDSNERPEAELEALAGFEGGGWAGLDDRVLTVDAKGLAPVEGSLYELWLLKFEDDELSDLVWLGVIADNGTYTIDPDVDLSAFDVVDISIEPDDGNPDHSGDSVLRGELT